MPKPKRAPKPAPLPKSRFTPYDKLADGLPSCLSENIRALRLEASLTYPAFANETGLSAPMLKQIEMGRRAPSLDALVSIARALDTTPSKLLEGVE